MARLSKNQKKANEKIEQGKLYKDYKRISSRRLTTILSQFASIHGFISMMKKNIVYKLYIGKNRTGTIVSWKSGKLIPSKIEEDEMVMGVIKEGKEWKRNLTLAEVLVDFIVSQG